MTKSRIMANVYLKTDSGFSLLDGPALTASSVSKYRPSNEAVEEVVQKLRDLGFEIEATGLFISISGSKELFEEICKSEIIYEDNPTPDKGTDKGPQSNPEVMNIPGLEERVEGIVLAKPGVIF